MPGHRTIQEGHNKIEKIEKDIRELFNAPVTVFTHMEPIEDPLSMNDIGIDRSDIVM
jgi:divalent metal cation (Fe/Co/Zn/Cd) transporter